MWMSGCAYIGGSGSGRQTWTQTRIQARRNRMRNHVGNKEQRMVSSVGQSIAFLPPPPPPPPSPAAVLSLHLVNRAPHHAPAILVRRRDLEFDFR
jgi:hypothetical protein